MKMTEYEAAFNKVITELQKLGRKDPHVKELVGEIVNLIADNEEKLFDKLAD